MVADNALRQEKINTSNKAKLSGLPSPLDINNLTLEAANNSQAPSHNAVLTSQEIHPLALEGARRLISQHTAKTPVEIKAWGTPDAVYAQVRQSLINFGYQIGMAEDMAEKLVEHAELHADSSRAKYGANIIALKIEVSRQKPQAQFETGALESQRIDGTSDKAEVAGATSVAIGINTGGTFTTALRDGVGEIMQAMAGAASAVWILFEAPNKTELQGIANDAALSAMAQIAGGSLTPEMIAELQSYADMGLLSPEMMGALENLYNIKIAAAGGNLDVIKSLSESIIDDLSTLLENGDATPDMLSTAIEALEIISNMHGLNASMDMEALGALKQNVQIAQIVSKLDIIASELEGSDRAILEELMEQFGALEGAELMAHLDTIPDQLKEAGVDGFDIADISSDISTLKETITQNLPLNQKLAILAALGAQDLMNVLQELNGTQNLPPELAELLEQMDVDNLSIEALQEVLVGKGDPALIEALQGTIIMLNNPEIQAALPQAALNQVTQFLGSQEALVDAVTAKAISTDLSAALVGLDATSIEAVKIQEVINRLEAGDSIDTIDPSIIEAVADKLEGSAAEKLSDTAKTLNNAGADNITVGSDTRAEITTLIQSGDLTSSAITQLENALETGNLNAVIEVLAQNPEVGTPILEKIITATQTDQLSPEAKSEITNLIAEIKKDPSLLKDPDVLAVVQQVIGAPPDSATPVGVIPSVVALAQNGGQSIRGVAAETVADIQQKLGAIANSLPSGAQVSEAVSQKIQAVTDVITKLDASKSPTVREIVNAVQNLNAVSAISTGSKVVGSAISSQILAIKGQLQTMVPKDIAPKIGGALKAALPTRESLSNTATGVKNNVADRLSALKAKVATTAQKFTPPAKDSKISPEPLRREPSKPKPHIGGDNPNKPDIRVKSEPEKSFSTVGQTRSTVETRQAENANISWGKTHEPLTSSFAKIAKGDFQGLQDLKIKAESLTKKFTQGCGQAACGTCKACGSALQKATSNIVARIPGLRNLVGPKVATTAERDQVATIRPNRS